METVRIRDGKKSDPGSGLNIPDAQNWITGTADHGIWSRFPIHRGVRKIMGSGDPCRQKSQKLVPVGYPEYGTVINGKTESKNNPTWKESSTPQKQPAAKVAVSADSLHQRNTKVTIQISVSLSWFRSLS
jgi:hypothetical protein